MVTLERLPQHDTHLLGLMEQRLEFPATAIAPGPTTNHRIDRFLTKFLQSIDLRIQIISKLLFEFTYNRHGVDGFLVFE
jgi:hypothetical protein